MKKRLLAIIFLLAIPVIYAECCSLNGTTIDCSAADIAYEGSCRATAHVIFYEDLSGNVQRYGLVEEGKLFTLKYGNTSLDFFLNEDAIRAKMLGDEVTFSESLQLKHTNGIYGLLQEENRLLIPEDKVIKDIKIGSLVYESNSSFNRAISFPLLDSMQHYINISGQNYEARETVAVKGALNGSHFVIQPGEMRYFYAFQGPIPITTITPSNSVSITFAGADMSMQSINQDGQRILVSYNSIATIGNNDLYMNEWLWKVGAISKLNLELANNETFTLKPDECKSFPNGHMPVCFIGNKVNYFTITFNANDSYNSRNMQSLEFEEAILFKEVKARKIYLAAVHNAEPIIIEEISEPATLQENKSEENITGEAKKEELAIESPIAAEKKGWISEAIKLKKPLTIVVIILGVLVLIIALSAQKE